MDKKIFTILIAKKSWPLILVFFQVEDPLEQAIKFLKPLQLLDPDRIDTHICAYEIYSRKGKDMALLSTFL